MTDLTRPREIADATAIPRLGRSEPIYLIGANDQPEDVLTRMGARKGSKGWTVSRSQSVDLAGLNDRLPRMARKSVTPHIVDLIPSSSWSSSLANLLVGGSWKVIRDVTAIRAGGCEECGEQHALECHEVWSYDDQHHVQRLERLETLCSPCHETRHLGYASVRGRYGIVLDRLVAINRLDSAERKVYADIVFERFEARSKIRWTLDLSLLSGYNMRVKKSFALVGESVLAGKAQSRRIETPIIGISMESSSRGVVLL